MQNRNILLKLNTTIENLKSVQSIQDPNEIQNGWDNNLRLKYLNILTELKRKIENNSLTDEDKEINLTIALDYDGVLNGKLHDMIIDSVYQWTVGGRSGGHRGHRTR